MPERQFGSFDSPFGIVITAHTNCPFGDAAASGTTLQAAQFQIYPATILETTFSPASSL